jgi:hypothetical protein
MRYDPRNVAHRLQLGTQLLAALQNAGFSRVTSDRLPAKTREDVYERVIDGTDGKMRVWVWTSAVAGQLRGAGSDAIRVTTVYATDNDIHGKPRGVGKEKRVFRTGKMDAIESRMMERMRDAWRGCKDLERCGCGAPKFTSKRKNLICADFCWK